MRPNSRKYIIPQKAPQRQGKIGKKMCASGGGNKRAGTFRVPAHSLSKKQYLRWIDNGALPHTPPKGQMSLWNPDIAKAI